MNNECYCTCKSWCRHTFLLLVGRFLGVESFGCVVDVRLMFKETVKLFSTVVELFHVLINNV